jgi:hypothetical protein
MGAQSLAELVSAHSNLGCNRNFAATDLSPPPKVFVPEMDTFIIQFQHEYQQLKSPLVTPHNSAGDGKSAVSLD